MCQLSKIQKINKRLIPNKSVAMGKIMKINKRLEMFIWQTRVIKCFELPLYGQFGN